MISGEVTWEDIREGTPRMSSHCAVALSVIRATGVSNVGVDVDCIRIGNKRYVTPPSVRKFINRYDIFGVTMFSSIFCRPFTFQLDEE